MVGGKFHFKVDQFNELKIVHYLITWNKWKTSTQGIKDIGMVVPAAGSPVRMFGCSSAGQRAWPLEALLLRERRKGTALP